MAEVNVSFSGGYGGGISYMAANTGEITIRVISQGFVLTDQSTIAAAINDLNFDIANNKKGIAESKAFITALNKDLVKFANDPFLTNTTNRRIKEAQDDIASSEKRIQTDQAAIASINATGQANLNKVIKQNNETLANLGFPIKATLGTTATPTANTKPGLAGAASDDSGAAPNSTASGSGSGGTTPTTAKHIAGGKSTSSPPQSGKSAPAEANASKSATPWQYSKKSSQPVASASRPGKRLQNPLGELASYTYQLTLYMLTPDAYDAFVNSGRTKINALSGVNVDPTSSTAAPPLGGTYIVAQSGGINNTSIPRAPDFEFDYGIDELQLRTLFNKKEGSPVTVTEVAFKIYEPYGFSFLTNLRKAGDTLYGSNTGNGNWGESGSNKLRQLFVLGIKFLGYDESGRIASPNLKLSDPTANGVLDPQNTSSDGTLFEHFIDIQINSLKFKIDGRMVVYNVRGIQVNAGKAFNISRGVLKYTQNITEGTVGDAVERMMVNLNKEQTDMASGDKPQIGIPNRFEVVWMPGTENIYNASMVSPADISKQHWPGSGAKSSAESNDATATKTQTADNNTTQVTLDANQPIVQALQQIVKQSEFMERQLAAIYTTEVQSDPKTKGNQKVKPSRQAHSLSWFNVTPQISSIKWDDKTKDWAYSIQYLITEYKTPINVSPMVNPNNDLYPGPVKRYSYWYTGENREVLSYEQTMDNTYMQVVVGVGDSALAVGAAEPTNGPGNSGTQTNTPVQIGQEAAPRTGRTGYGMDAQNSFLTALFDAKAYLNAKVTIMGDPDWLPHDPIYNEQLIYDTYYGTTGYGISPSSSQVFVEIDFKEAVDYTSETGTMNINESIAFVQYPKTMTNKPKGVSYQVMGVDHTFSGGVFKQTLDLIGNSFGDKANQDALAAQLDEANKKFEDQQNAAATTPDNSNATSGQATGTTSDPKQQTNVVQGNAQPATNTPATPTTQTKTGPVANDDGKKT